MTKSKITVLILALLLGLACKKKKQDPVTEPPPDEPVELVTSCFLTLTDSATGNQKVYSFRDPDGPGGQPAFYGGVQQSDSLIVLKDNQRYEAKLLFLNESVTPADTVSNEMREESADHMIFFDQGVYTVLSNEPYSVQLNNQTMAITYLDQDDSEAKLPLGLHTSWKAGNAYSGNRRILITVKHQPGAKNRTFAPGETDVEVSFAVSVVN